MSGKKAENYYIFSDIDGTLLTSPEIPKVNREAIERFMTDGGLFSLATGRAMLKCKPVAQELRVNAPCILFDGAAIYDFASDTLLESLPLPPDSPELVERLIRRYPNMGVSVSTMQGTYEVGVIYPYVPPSHHDFRSMVRDIPGDWMKIVLYSPDGMARDILPEAREMGLDKLSAVASHDMFINITANGCSKGAAIKRLQSMGWGQSRQSVAIGDYDNDLAMLRSADIAACPDNAAPGVKAVSQRVFCSAQDGAVAQLIDFLTT